MDALKIKYEDSELILAVKPAGVATESRRIGEKDMISIMKNYRVGKGEDSYIGMIHRLDQPVGGLLLFAKTKEMAAALSRQIQEGIMEKYYQALLCGRIEPEGELTDYLLKEGKGNISRVVEKGTPGAKKASLKFRRLNVFSADTGEVNPDGTVSLVEIKLETGRHHQIRVQMAHHGFPLLGDRKYNQQEKRQSEQTGGWRGLALFAWRLKFRHPRTGEWMEFQEEPEFLTVSDVCSNL